MYDFLFCECICMYTHTPTYIHVPIIWNLKHNRPYHKQGIPHLKKQCVFVCGCGYSQSCIETSRSYPYGCPHILLLLACTCCCACNSVINMLDASNKLQYQKCFSWLSMIILLFRLLNYYVCMWSWLSIHAIIDIHCTFTHHRVGRLYK